MPPNENVRGIKWVHMYTLNLRARATGGTISTPGSGVRGLKESVPTINADRARPLSGGFVIQIPQSPLHGDEIAIRGIS
eukprot:1575869-Pleurochrysis_carterae.AAC.3